MFTVYQLTNNTNSRSYIGYTEKERLSDVINTMIYFSLEKPVSDRSILERDIARHGSNFSISPIKMNIETKLDAIKEKNLHISARHPYYNENIKQKNVYEREFANVPNNLEKLLSKKTNTKYDYPDEKHFTRIA